MYFWGAGQAHNGSYFTNPAFSADNNSHNTKWPPVPFLTQKHFTKTFQIFIQKLIYIFTASSWTYRNILIIEKNCHYQHELIVTTMSALVSFTKLEETLFQKEWISGIGERWESVLMTRKSVAFGLPWCTSGLKKVVFDDRMIMMRRIHLRGSQGSSSRRAQKTKARGPKASTQESGLEGPRDF